MKKITSHILIVVACLGAGFIFGYLFSEASKQKKLIAYFIDMVDMRHQDTAARIGMLESLFKTYSENPDKLPEDIKRLMAMMYETDTRITGLLGQDYGQDNGIYLNNKKIEDFLIKHPLNECSKISKDGLLECNLNNIFIKDKK